MSVKKKNKGWLTIEDIGLIRGKTLYDERACSV